MVQLHCHSTFSLLEGIGKIPKLLEKAKQQGMGALALTDYHGLYGCVEFYEYAKKNEIKAILGVELTLTADINNPKAIHGTICLLAMNDEGYHNLIQLTSLENTTGSKDYPKIDFTALEKHSAGCIAFMGGEKSFLGSLIRANTESKKIQEYRNRIQKIFGERFYGEIIAQDYALVPEIKAINDECLKLCQSTNTQAFAATNVHYVSPDEKKAYEVALCIKDANKIYDDHRRKVIGDYRLMGEEDVRAILKRQGHTAEKIDELIALTDTIADLCNVKIQLGATYFPHHQSHQNIIDLYEANKENVIVQ